MVCIYTHTHTQRGISLRDKKWHVTICSNTDGPRGYYTKWNKSERERQILYGIIYLWNPKNNTNEIIYKIERLTDIENKLMITKGERGRRDKLGVWN